MTSNRATSITPRDQLFEQAGRLAGFVLALAGILAFLVLCYSLVTDLEAPGKVRTPTAIVLNYALPASAVVGLFAALRLTPVNRLRVLMAGLSIVVAVYAVELGLALSRGTDDQIRPAMTRVASSRHKARDAAELTRRFGGSIDTRTPREVLAALQSEGSDAVPIVTASNHLFVAQADGSIKSAIEIDGHEVMPLGGVSQKVTLLCNENGQWIDYRSDRRGFNNPDEIWDTGHLDIAVLGDSFAHGYCVPAAASYVSLISQHDRATLNLGMAGDGPLLMLATLEEYLPRFSPKIVLWCYYEGNDLIDLQAERKSRLLRSYLEDGFAQPLLSSRQRDIDRATMAEMPRLENAEERDANLRERNAARYLLRSILKLTFLRERLGIVSETDRSSSEMAADFDGPNFDVFRQIVSRANTKVSAWGGEMYFVYLPEWARYTKYQSGGKLKRDSVLKMVRDLGIRTIDIDPVFRSNGDPLSLFPFRQLGHYTEAGHRLVAETVLRQLTSNHAIE
jgi:hypothetical protein